MISKSNRLLAILEDHVGHHLTVVSITQPEEKLLVLCETCVEQLLLEVRPEGAPPIILWS